MKTTYFSLSAIFCLLLCSCFPLAAQTPAPSVTSSPVPTATARPTFTTSPTIAPTVTPTPPASAWSVIDPRDPQAQKLIFFGKAGYQLDPAWQPVHIEYLYQWWGLGDPVLNDQQIDYQAGKYIKDNLEVPAEKVKSLLSSISHLYPTQFMLAGNDHTDDYPSWTVELTDQAGNRVLLLSSSTANPGEAPWNLFYNGQLYAQYDGSLGNPLLDLFPGPEGQSAASFYPGGATAGTVVFSTSGWPAQLTEGFVGLLPFADGFTYQADNQTGKIQAYIQGRSSIGGMGTMVIGKITGIDKVVLTRPDGTPQTCLVAPLSSTDPSGAAWSFTCGVDPAVAGRHYRYPIEITYHTDDKQTGTSQGQLVGVWGASADALSLPLPEELQAIFSQNRVTRDLLTDHIPITVSYTAQMDPALPRYGSLTGEAVLLGQTEVQGQTLRYTIATPFTVENGTLSYWSLTRAALDKMLAEITPLGLTKRVMTLVPTAQLNMWYAEKTTNLPSLPTLINASIPDYSLHGSACGNIPAWSLPSDTQPFEGFGFNNGWNLWMADFVLLDGRPIVNDLDLSPNQNDRGGLLPLLIPNALDTGKQTPFDRIWVEANAYGTKPPTLTLWIPKSADAASQTAYDKISAALPATVNKIDDTWWEVPGMTFVVQPDGELGVMACNSK